MKRTLEADVAREGDAEAEGEEPTEEYDASRPRPLTLAERLRELEQDRTTPFWQRCLAAFAKLQERLIEGVTVRGARNSAYMHTDLPDRSMWPMLTTLFAEEGVKATFSGSAHDNTAKLTVTWKRE